MKNSETNNSSNINTNKSSKFGLNNVFTYHNYHATYSQNKLNIYNQENKLVHSETIQDTKNNLNNKSNNNTIESKFHHYVDGYNNSINAYSELPNRS